MTDMKRITVSFPDEIDRTIFALKSTELFSSYSYAEIVRQLVKLGLDRIESGEAERASA